MGFVDLWWRILLCDVLKGNTKADGARHVPDG
jgi:hypothetical protein